VCSGYAIVLRENREMIVEGFLPLILNTDDLWNFAIANAAGSMSKRVKWRDLAEYEFVLPPKAEQRRFADILVCSPMLRIIAGSPRSMNPLSHQVDTASSYGMPWVPRLSS
jgi:hypothetical protein